MRMFTRTRGQIGHPGGPPFGAPWTQGVIPCPRRAHFQCSAPLLLPRGYSALMEESTKLSPTYFLPLVEWACDGTTTQATRQQVGGLVRRLARRVKVLSSLPCPTPSLTITLGPNLGPIHTTRRRSKRLKGASERAKNASKDTPNGPVSFLEKVMFDPFLTIFDAFSVDAHRPKSPKMRLNGDPVGKKPL